ncbi:MAG: DUF4381 domain-containing protein [Magnetococcales bacterium]|nr:DUF4381 domain-containing protein [Magnetococcales bacterium]
MELRDIHLPDPVAWWPPALGWWLLLLAPLAALLLRSLYRAWSGRRKVRKTALAELERLVRAYDEHQDAQRLTAELSALLRRVCLVHHHPTEVAGIGGQEWLAFLDRGLPDRPFSQGPGAVLITAPFQPRAQVQVEALLSLCRQWLHSLPNEKTSRSQP